MGISQHSVQSLLLTLMWNENPFSTATGFVVVHDDRPYLVTNWHVLSGRNPETGAYMSSHGVMPDTVLVRYLLVQDPAEPGVLRWQDFGQRVVDENERPLWLEHPTYGRKVDVVALPLTVPDDVQLLPYGLDEESPRLRAGVSDWVNIIGFPFGVTAGGALAVWTKGGLHPRPKSISPTSRAF
jgi:hypothetical protein